MVRLFNPRQPTWVEHFAWQDANRARHRHRAATESSLARQRAQSVGQRRVASAGGVVFSWPGLTRLAVPAASPDPRRYRTRAACAAGSVRISDMISRISRCRTALLGYVPCWAP
jgi:hypothetical protein